MNAKFPTLLTPGELAEILRIPAARAVRFARRHGMPHYTLPDGELLFDEAEIREWLKGSKAISPSSRN